MHIYWKEMIRQPMTKAEAQRLVDDLRTLLADFRAERAAFEDIVKRVERATE